MFCKGLVPTGNDELAVNFGGNGLEAWKNVYEALDDDLNNFEENGSNTLIGLGTGSVSYEISQESGNFRSFMVVSHYMYSILFPDEDNLRDAVKAGASGYL